MAGLGREFSPSTIPTSRVSLIRPTPPPQGVEGGVEQHPLLFGRHVLDHDHAAEAAAIGHDFQGSYGWPYPPSFLFVAATRPACPMPGPMGSGS
jgi:hypothetical protein